jgi:hypothetical protein
MNAITDLSPPTIAPLWQRTHAMLARAVAALGAPVAIAPPHRTDPALLLARRFEALHRVLQDPPAYARRLLRRLLAIRQRFPRVVERYAFASAHTGDYDPDDPRLRIEVWGPALDARSAFADTS